jgi:hypothetical protein
MSNFVVRRESTLPISAVLGHVSTHVHGIPGMKRIASVTGEDAFRVHRRVSLPSLSWLLAISPHNVNNLQTKHRRPGFSSQSGQTGQTGQTWYSHTFSGAMPTPLSTRVCSSYICYVAAFDPIACTRSTFGNGCILSSFFSFILTSNKH